MSLLDKASLIVTPNAYKESKLYSVVPNTTLGDMDVVRATTATRVNNAGLIEVVPYNLLTYSNTFSNGNWGKTSVNVTSGQSGYDGTLNAWLLASTTTPTAYLSQSITVNVNSLFSVYLKKGNLDWAMFLTSGTTFANFDLNNGVLGSLSNCTATIESVGNGWYKCTIKPSIAGVNVRIYPANGDNTRTITGNILIQNAQLEESTSAKEYFPTTTRLDIPRLDYTNGSCPNILVEPQRTNLVLRSEELDNATWNKFGSLTISANSTTSPSGVSNADKIIPNSGTGIFAIGQSFVKANSNITYTLSGYAKPSGYDFLLFRIDSLAGNGIKGSFNISTGTISTAFSNEGVGFTFINANITNANDGWVKWHITFTSDLLFSLRAIIFVSSVDGNPFLPPSYTANGTSGAFIWGAQLELGSYPTSYIPTVASSVTRNADVISKTGISSLIGQTEGTIYAEIKVTKLLGAASRYVFHLSDGTANNRIYIAFSGASSNVLRARIFSGGTLQCSINSSALTSTGTYKLAMAYKNNDIVFYINGIQIGTDTSATIPTCSKVDLGHNQAGASQFNDGINNANIWKTRLTNDELAELTTL
jgi:hypothetical protein